MIIGNGDIASVLEDHDDYVFFVSGVSNSLETKEEAFEQEKGTLMNMPFDKHLVYISSLSVYFKKNRYTYHKAEMERLIREYWKNHTIIRIGNITWGNNPNTLINYLKANPDAEIQNDYRHIITPEAFKFWLNFHMKSCGTYDVTGETLKVQEIKDRIDKGLL